MSKKNSLLFLSLFFFATLGSVAISVEENFLNKIVNLISDSQSFALRFISNPIQMGSILPSSDSLTKEITKYVVRSKQKGKRILEVGAGTGVFTEQIVKHLSDNDLLDVVEIDDEMCKLLTAKFKKNANVNIYKISILDLKVDCDYDYIVSGLPFNAFEACFVKSVLDKYKKIIKKDGVISYFEYAAIPSITKFLMTALLMFERKEKYLSVLNETKSFRDSCAQYEKQIVFQNVPPAYVHFMKL